MEHVVKTDNICDNIPVGIDCLKLIIEILEQNGNYVWRRSGIFIVNFEHVLNLALAFLLPTLNMLLLAWIVFARASWKTGPLTLFFPGHPYYNPTKRNYDYCQHSYFYRFLIFQCDKNLVRTYIY